MSLKYKSDLSFISCRLYDECSRWYMYVIFTFCNMQIRFRLKRQTMFQDENQLSNFDFEIRKALLN